MEEDHFEGVGDADAPAGLLIDFGEEDDDGVFGDGDDEAFEDAAEVAVAVDAGANAAGIPAGVAVVAGLPPPPLGGPAAAVAAALADEGDDDDALVMANMDDDQFQQFLGTVRNTLGTGRSRLDNYESGDGTDWAIWRRNCVTRITVNGWNNQRARREIATAMKGAAAAWIQDIDIADAAIPLPAGAPAGAVADAADYNLLLDAYEARFLPPAASDVLRVQFQKAMQREGETVLAWHSRLRHLFTRAYPHLNAAAVQASPDLKDRFILGLSDAKVRENTWNRRPADYMTAYLDASNLTAGEVVLHGREADPFAPPPVKKEIGQLGEDGEGTNALRAGTKKSGQRGIECHRCHKTGHMAKECWAPAPAGKPGRGGRGGQRSGRGRGGGGRVGKSGDGGRRGDKKGGRTGGRGGRQRASGSSANLRVIKQMINAIRGGVEDDAAGEEDDAPGTGDDSWPGN